MPRSRRRAADKRVSNSSPGIKNRRTQQQPNRSSHGASATPQPTVSEPATPSSIDMESSAADRYNNMAEYLNVQGAMEMAVPFYRQAIALLLAERENLQAQLGYESSNSVQEDLPLEELNCLLKSAEAIQNVETKDDRPRVEDQIQELASELNQASALQVMAGLRAIAEGSDQPIPASGLALLAKAQMLLGKTEDGLRSFEAALAAEPDSTDFKINTGAARLADGDIDGALTLLRGVYEAGIDKLNPTIVPALLRNLSVAEARSDQRHEALKLRLELFQIAPQSVSKDRWLKWAKDGLALFAPGDSARTPAMDLLKALQEQHPQDRKVMQCLANALEDQDDYRGASLLYRQLLRPE